VYPSVFFFFICGDVSQSTTSLLLIQTITLSPQMKKKKTDGYTSNFAFQLHKRQAVEVRFKDIQIMTPTYVDKDGKLTGKFIGCGQFL